MGISPWEFPLQVADKLVKSDGSAPTEEEIDELEKKIDDYEQKEYQARYVIQSTVSARINLQIKGKTAAEMWSTVKKDATEKGQSYKVDVQQRLQTIHCHNESDLRGHLVTVTQLREELAEMGVPLDDEEFATGYIPRIHVGYTSLGGSYWTDNKARCNHSDRTRGSH